MKDKKFKPSWWLPGPHFQTLWPFLFTPRGKQNLQRERFELPDGDFVDLDWAHDTSGPLVLILHGLEGSSSSSYIRRLIPVLNKPGFQPVVMHFRGCSGEPNRLLRAYHAGDTQDLAEVVLRLRKRYPDRMICAIGFSLGGNVLLKWLGETGSNNPLSAAAAVSTPFDLNAAADRLESGVSKIYQRYLLQALRSGQIRKVRHNKKSVTLSETAIRRLRTLREFDDCVTAPIHGFKDAQDYYSQVSSRQWLRYIDVPTLLIQALDDPFFMANGIPGKEELSPSIHLEVTRKGGHVGFVSGKLPGLTQPWLETRLSTWVFENTSGKE